MPSNTTSTGTTCPYILRDDQGAVKLLDTENPDLIPLNFEPSGINPEDAAPEDDDPLIVTPMDSDDLRAFREEVVDECEDHMEDLRLSAEAIRDFQAFGRPNYAMDQGQWVPLTTFELNRMRRLEADNGCMVYAVIRSSSRYGRLLNYLIVNPYKDDWYQERWILRRKNKVMAYVHNCDDPERSDEGLIEVKRLPNGLLDRVISSEE